MNRERAIEIIKFLYPANSQYKKTSEIGQKLLEQAKIDTASWENEPTTVLIRYAELCIEEERKC